MQKCRIPCNLNTQGCGIGSDMQRAMTDPGADTEFAAYLQWHRAELLQFLRRLSGDDAEDLLQETHAKVWRYRRSWNSDRKGGWVALPGGIPHSDRPPTPISATPRRRRRTRPRAKHIVTVHRRIARRTAAHSGRAVADRAVAAIGLPPRPEITTGLQPRPEAIVEVSPGMKEIVHLPAERQKSAEPREAPARRRHCLVETASRCFPSNPTSGVIR